jgi:hypothetical protein
MHTTQPRLSFISQAIQDWDVFSWLEQLKDEPSWVSTQKTALQEVLSPKSGADSKGLGLATRTSLADGLIDFFLTFHKVAPTHRSMITTKAGKHVILPGVGRVPSLRIPKLTLSLSGSRYIEILRNITHHYTLF